MQARNLTSPPNQQQHVPLDAHSSSDNKSHSGFSIFTYNKQNCNIQSVFGPPSLSFLRGSSVVSSKSQGFIFDQDDIRDAFGQDFPEEKNEKQRNWGDMLMDPAPSREEFQATGDVQMFRHETITTMKQVFHKEPRQQQQQAPPPPGLSLYAEQDLNNNNDSFRNPSQSSKRVRSFRSEDNDHLNKKQRGRPRIHRDGKTHYQRNNTTIQMKNNELQMVKQELALTRAHMPSSQLQNFDLLRQALVQKDQVIENLQLLIGIPSGDNQLQMHHPALLANPTSPIALDPTPMVTSKDKSPKRKCSKKKLSKDKVSKKMFKQMQTMMSRLQEQLAPAPSSPNCKAKHDRYTLNLVFICIVFYQYVFFRVSPASCRITSFVSVRVKNSLKRPSLRKVQRKLISNKDKNISLTEESFAKLYCISEDDDKVVSFADMWMRDSKLTTKILYKMPCFSSVKEKLDGFLLDTYKANN